MIKTQINFGALESAMQVEILRSAKNIVTGLTVAKLAEIADCKADRMHNLFYGKGRFQPFEVRNLESFLNSELKPFELNYLKEKHKKEVPEFGRKETDYEIFFHKLIGKEHAWNNQLIDEKCSGKVNGSYALIRVGYKNQIYISNMLITNSNNGIPPQFLTTKRTTMGNFDKVRGVFIRHGADYYTLGRMIGRDGLRMTRMKALNRGSTRVDFCGLRLGESTKMPMPYAHRVYCFQMGRYLSKEDRKVIIGTHRPGELDNIRKKENIPIIDEIVDLLKVSDVEENGIFGRLAE